MTLQTADKEKQYFWLLLAACFVSLFLFLGETLFNTRGSSREAVVALTMLRDGNWILPINNGVDMAYKPPFLHWLIALCSLPFGEVSELTARIPSALALTVLVMVGYRFFARREGAKVAFVMGLITLTNFEVHRAGVGCRVDMLLATMTVLALYTLYIWMERGMKGVPWWSVLCLSGAFLTKGPVGLALPCLVVWVFGLLRSPRSWVSLTLRIAGVGILGCLLPLAWYVAAWQQGGDKFLALIYEENVLRLLGKMTYESHINPWPYNLMTVTAGFVPYTLLVVMSLFVLPWRRWMQPVGQVWGKFWNRLLRMDDARLFSLLSFLVIFVFYCIPKSKRSTYLLPIYPFLAYFLAEFILWLRKEHGGVVKAFTWIVSSLGLVLTLAFVVVRLGLVPDTLLGGRRPEEGIAMMQALRSEWLNPLQWLAWAAPLVVFVCWTRWARAGRHVVATLLLSVTAIFFALDGVYQPLVLNVKSDKPVADRIARLLPEGRMYSFRTDVTPGNPMHPFTVNFYLGDRIVPFEAFMPRAGYLLVGNEEIEAFKERYPDYRVVERIDFKHRSCDDHKYLHLYQFTLAHE